MIRLNKLLIIVLLYLLFSTYFHCVEGIIKNEESGSYYIGAVLNQKKKENVNLMNTATNNNAGKNGCAFNKYDLSMDNCKAFDGEKYKKKRSSSIRKIRYYIHRSPHYIADVITFRTIRRIHKASMNTILSTVGHIVFTVTYAVIKILNIYLKSKYRQGLRYILETFLFRFLATYFLQLCTSFLSFHYFNTLSQKIQCDYDMNISRSMIFSRVIGFIELNLVNHYLVIFSETIQIFFIRLFFNRYETCLVKSMIYNSDDYLISYDHSNKYVVFYHLIKKFLTARLNKLSLLNSNYIRYLLCTNIFFYLFGGSYNKYCPSEVTMPGVYADIKKSIPKDMTYATKKELAILRENYYANGCHTCGTVNCDKFVGDHQPPVQIVKDNIKYFNQKSYMSRLLYFFRMYDTSQRLYAQCIKCSQIQAATVRCKKRRLVAHAFTIRFFHYASVIHLFIKMMYFTKWSRLLDLDNDLI